MLGNVGVPDLLDGKEIEEVDIVLCVNYKSVCLYKLKSGLKLWTICFMTRPEHVHDK